jgi:flagellar hook protein FlgE
VLRSLYTGISGMRSHQTMMDVTGNNIANVNTTGYKTANTIFEDTLSQTLAAAGAPQGQQGGTNPAQVGLGVRVAGITTNFSQGATQVTGRNTDMLINGDGFFVVRQNGVNQYTRSGAFSVDATGQLVNLGGSQVMGWQADVRGEIDTAAVTTPLTIPTGLLKNPRATENLVFAGNLNSTATPPSAATPGTPGNNGPDGTAGTPDDVAAVPASPAVAGDTFTRPWPIFDRAGVSNNAAVKFTAMAPTTGTIVTQWAVEVSYGTTTATATYDVNAGFSAPTGGATAAGKRLTLPALIGSDTQTFPLTVDFTKLTSSPSTAGESSASVQSQDGAAAGVLQSWNMTPDGTLLGTFSNGETMNIGKVAVASFDNPSGLEKQGGSLYAASVNSGLASVGSAGDAGRGTLVSGALEMSNVDLAQEFTNLIVSQRGFQANSRVITSSDEMLQELVNLKR